MPMWKYSCVCVCVCVCVCMCVCWVMLIVMREKVASLCIRFEINVKSKTENRQTGIDFFFFGGRERGWFGVLE